MWKFSQINNRKDQILARRRKLCLDFFESIYEKFLNILSGNIPYVYSAENECFIELNQGCSMNPTFLNKNYLLKNDYILVGGYEFSACKNTMPVEMAACMLGDMWGYVGAWKIEYNCDNDYIYVYFKYNADYKIIFENQFCFKVVDSTNNSVLGSNIPLDKIEDVIQELKGTNKPIFDILNTELWYVHLTKQRKPIMFDPNKFKTYPNIYVGMITNGNEIKYEPLIFISPTKKTPWISQDYEDHPYVKDFIKQIMNTSGKDNNGLQQQRNIQNQKWQNLNPGRLAPNQQKQGQAQKYGAGKPIYNPNNSEYYH